jgi:hypothetical protein
MSLEDIRRDHFPGLLVVEESCSFVSRGSLLKPQFLWMSCLNLRAHHLALGGKFLEDF